MIEAFDMIAGCIDTFLAPPPSHTAVGARCCSSAARLGMHFYANH